MELRLDAMLAYLRRNKIGNQRISYTTTGAFEAQLFESENERSVNRARQRDTNLILIAKKSQSHHERLWTEKTPSYLSHAMPL